MQHTLWTRTMFDQICLNRGPYWAIYQTLPWVMMMHLCIFIIIHKLYPNPSELDYLSLDTAHKTQIWRIYTYMLLHGNFIHLMSNCVLITMFTILSPTHQSYQQWRFYLIFTLSVIHSAGGIGWEHTYRGERLILIGSSGGGYGLIGAKYADFLLNWQVIPFVWVELLLTAGSISIEILCWFFVSEHVLLVGHVAGFTGGFLSGLVFNIDAISDDSTKNRVCRTMGYVLLPTVSLASTFNYFMVF